MQQVQLPLFEIYLSQYGKNEKCNFHIYWLNVTITKKRRQISWNIKMKKLNNNSKDTGQWWRM